MDELISVIIPVYKVEKYLHKCVDSVINQTYSTLEIILVDDGSPDKCGEICEEYAAKDKRVKVIHQENTGLSGARNTGLKNARGAYITFLDSDDYFASNFIEKLHGLLKANNADISICADEFVLEQKNGQIKVLKRPYKEFNGIKVMTAKEALSITLRQDIFDAKACAKLYKIELFQDIKYPLGYAYEDEGTTYKLFINSKILVYTGEPLYFYLQRNGSILHSNSSSKRYWDGILMVEKQYNDVISIFPTLKASANSRLLSMYFHAFIGGRITDDRALMQHSWNGIKKSRNIQDVSIKLRTKLSVAIILSYFGEKFFSFITKLIYK